MDGSPRASLCFIGPHAARRGYEGALEKGLVRTILFHLFAHPFRVLLALRFDDSRLWLPGLTALGGFAGRRLSGRQRCGHKFTG